MTVSKLSGILFGIIAMVIASCEKEIIEEPAPTQQTTTTTPPPPPNYNYTVNLARQTWVITKYQDPSLNQFVISDTLRFFSDSAYTYDHVAETYSIRGNWHDHQVTFRLFGTPFGDMVTGNGSGNPYVTFDAQGMADSVFFLNQNSQLYYLWIQKLPVGIY